MPARQPLCVAFNGVVMSPRALSPAELRAWLRFAGTPGIPPAVARALLDAFGSPAALFDAPDDAIAAASSPAAARTLRENAPADLAAHTDAALAWLDAPGNSVVTLGDPAYPPRLADLHDPPPLLYVKGRTALLHAGSVAVVGSRHATPQGLADATHFARSLSDAGFAIVSGLALGIDGAAHRGGLDGRSSTIAVIGTGADLVYPARHRALAHEIAARGAIVSEWPLGAPARAEHFPQRNRLIAGLARGVLVVEAAPRSGSLITARLANEMGRDVFAVPGSIHAPLAQGCHALIRDGAKLTAAPSDVLEEFGECGIPRSTPAPDDDAPSPPVANSDECAVIAALGYGPVTFEWLAEHAGLPDDALHRALLALELAGRVASLPGARFVRLNIPAAPATAPSARGAPGVLQSRA
ncbi:DNA-processing protein DprA [Burkholderia guangdongensis]|uniref:DNA-processing protein DprA n=1 Tax=Burkholderia guangdongensis TaxID=1792500 RepID=UPI0015CB91E0|nr:DNA-processing protein DprA [Burkholderia guangdongensis]